MKRLRAPKAKPGQLVARWGKVEGNIDLCYAWGPGVDRSDARLLNTVLSGERYRPSMKNYPGYEVGPSFFDELESRGYDLTTLKFSVEKKKNVPLPTPTRESDSSESH